MSRLIHARMLLAVAIAVTIGALEIRSLMAPTPQATAKHDAAPLQAEPVPLLPTIRVFAPEEIPTLPLVIVRPAVEPAFVIVSTPRVVVAFNSIARSRTSSSGDMPHGRLDMPYYSFGKMLPNVIKD